MALTNATGIVTDADALYNIDPAAILKSNMKRAPTCWVLTLVRELFPMGEEKRKLLIRVGKLEATRKISLNYIIHCGKTEIVIKRKGDPEGI